MKPVLIALSCVYAFSTNAQPMAGVGYEAVRAAYVALKNDPEARAKSNQGWLLVTVPGGTNEGIWSFTPQSDPSFPAVVRRKVLERDGQLFVEMGVLCGGAKEACDQLVAAFNTLNEEMKKEVAERRKN
jgi:hypothetical protein